MNVKHVEVKLVFSIWNNELEINDVPKVITEAVERAGYSLENIEVVKTVETEEE